FYRAFRSLCETAVSRALLFSPLDAKNSDSTPRLMPARGGPVERAPRTLATVARIHENNPCLKPVAAFGLGRREDEPTLRPWRSHPGASRKLPEARGPRARPRAPFFRNRFRGPRPVAGFETALRRPRRCRWTRARPPPSGSKRGIARPHPAIRAPHW